MTWLPLCCGDNLALPSAAWQSNDAGCDGERSCNTEDLDRPEASPSVSWLSSACMSSVPNQKARYVHTHTHRTLHLGGCFSKRFSPPGGCLAPLWIFLSTQALGAAAEAVHPPVGMPPWCQLPNNVKGNSQMLGPQPPLHCPKPTRCCGQSRVPMCMAVTFFLLSSRGRFLLPACEFLSGSLTGAARSGESMSTS